MSGFFSRTKWKDTHRSVFIFYFLDNCIRQEKGYCRIQWEESSGVTNPFQMDTVTTGTPAGAGGMTGTTAAQVAVPCALAAGAHTAFVTIPEGSNTGVSPLNPSLSYLQYQSLWCGRSLSYPSQTTPIPVVCKSLHKDFHRVGSLQTNLITSSVGSILFYDNLWYFITKHCTNIWPSQLPDSPLISGFGPLQPTRHLVGLALVWIIHRSVEHILEIERVS